MCGISQSDKSLAHVRNDIIQENEVKYLGTSGDEPGETSRED